MLIFKHFIIQFRIFKFNFALGFLTFFLFSNEIKSKNYVNSAHVIDNAGGSSQSSSYINTSAVGQSFGFDENNSNIFVNFGGFLPELNNVDSDRDGLSDADEVVSGTDPNIHALKDRLLLHYTFDADSYGINPFWGIEDASGNNRRGSIRDLPENIKFMSNRFGRTKEAMKFSSWDNLGREVIYSSDTAKPSFPETINSNQTVSFWFYLSDYRIVDNQVLFEFWDFESSVDELKGFEFLVNGKTKSFHWAASGKQKYQSSRTPIEFKKWHHVLLILGGQWHDSNNQKGIAFLLDGKLTGVFSNTELELLNVNFKNKNLRIGASKSDPYSKPFHGLIDDFRLYDRSIGKKEIELFVNVDNPTIIVANPKPIDSDSDGLTDIDEVNDHKTNPTLADTDGDGLSDGDEINKYNTNPLASDSDGDNFSDNEELAAGTDPNNNKNYPVKIEPPVITASPKSVYVKTNNDAEFQIQASGTTLTYQWFFNNSLLAGADRNTLTIPKASKKNEGTYTVEISNEAGTASRNSTLTLVEEPPVFISIPDRFDLVYEKGETMILSPKVKSVGPTTFQWYKEGNKLEGETKLILKIKDVDYDDADNYSLVAKNIFDTTTSETMRVSVVDEAKIGQHINNKFPKIQGLVDSSPAVGKDGSIYYATVGESGYLYSHKSNGERKWGLSFNSALRGSPAIDDNEVIYVLEDTGALHAIENRGSSGKKLWKYNLKGDEIDAEGEYREFGNSPAITKDGTIIFGWFDRNVYAVKNGNLVWNFPTEGRILASPSIALDGTIYIGDEEGNLYAIKPDGTSAWPKPFSTGEQIITRPAIDSEGNIYFGSFSDKFYAIDSNRVPIWTFDTKQDIWSSAVIRADGTVYFGADNGYFYALSTETGEVKWTYRIKENWQRSSTAVLGLDGSIYFTLWDNSFYSINRIGKKLWSVKLKGDGDDAATFSSPSLLDDGKIYVGIQDGDNGRINIIQGGSPIDTNSPWPSFGGDMQNTGRVVDSTSNTDSFRPELRLIDIDIDSITIQITGDAFENYKLQSSNTMETWEFVPEAKNIQTNFRGKATFKTSIIGNGPVFFRLITE